MKDSSRMAMVVFVECVSFNSRMRREITSLRSRCSRAEAATTSAKGLGAGVAAAIPEGRPVVKGSAAPRAPIGRASTIVNKRSLKNRILGFPRVGADHEIALDRSKHGYSALVAQLAALGTETFGILERDRIFLLQGELDIIFPVEHADFDDVRRSCTRRIERNGKLINRPVVDEFDIEIFHFRDPHRLVVDLDVEEVAVIRQVPERL